MIFTGFDEPPIKTNIINNGHTGMVKYLFSIINHYNF